MVKWFWGLPISIGVVCSAWGFSVGPLLAVLLFPWLGYIQIWYFFPANFALEHTVIVVAGLMVWLLGAALGHRVFPSPVSKIALMYSGVAWVGVELMIAGMLF